MKIIENCSNIISTLERLRLLLVLTVCDIKSVGPNVWSDWRSTNSWIIYKNQRQFDRKIIFTKLQEEKIDLKKAIFSLKKKSGMKIL